METFTESTTSRVDGKSTLFLSDRRMDNNTIGSVYETDVTGLQASDIDGKASQEHQNLAIYTVQVCVVVPRCGMHSKILC